MEFVHVPVLFNETIEGLNIEPSGTYVDGTFGGGGHADGVISRLNGNGRFVGIDQDADAIENGRTRLSAYTNKNAQLVRDNFRNIKAVMSALQIERVNGILIDIGVSSHQLDEGERGFSYMQDAKLDMRMDQRRELTAGMIVNTYSEQELLRVIRDFGEERWAARIASFIVSEREKAPLETTGQLVEVIRKAIPAKARKDGPHPAKRTFQALRIEVNDELGILEDSIRDMVDLLIPGGRLCVITFHSLEDRIVKQTFKNLENPCTCPVESPICICGKKPLVNIVTRKPIEPSDRELEMNPRSRSAKLRIVEKLETPLMKSPAFR
ncbi:MAG: 16S rRNA (cytosine(1402)-N(4))-methyltransferase RsmH [Lachnospiraceae bacterium]|nr:16S rRNA (cytosine(1402)-N(4))-methyltransferase RsmH [Lachnospiraceae bacterium]